MVIPSSRGEGTQLVKALNAVIAEVRAVELRRKKAAMENKSAFEKPEYLVPSRRDR